MLAGRTGTHEPAPPRRSRSRRERPPEPVAPNGDRRRISADRPHGDGAGDRKRAEDQRDRQQPVDAVEDAAMAGDQLARILDAGAAFHPAFAQVAELRDPPYER